MNPVCRLCNSHDLLCEIDQDCKVYQCRDCGLVQNLTADEHGDIPDYCDDIRQEYLQQLALRFRDKLSLSAQPILCVNRGDPEFVQELIKLGSKVDEIDWAELDRDWCKVLSHHDPYSVFVIRHAIEHVTDLQSFMRGLKRCITPDAVGLIEVARLETLLPAFDPQLPIWQQANHFGLSTLGILIEVHGFDIVDMFMGWQQRRNAVIVRRRRPWQFVQPGQDLVLSIG